MLVMQGIGLLLECAKESAKLSAALTGTATIVVQGLPLHVLNDLLGRCMSLSTTKVGVFLTLHAGGELSPYDLIP
jgi:hypothetical protein